MFRRFSANFAVFSIFTDALLAALALHLSVLLRPFFNNFEFIKALLLPIDIPWVLYLLFPLMWVGVNLLFSVYDGRRNFKIINELTSLTFGSLLAAVAMAGILYFSFREISRFLFGSFIVIGFFLQAAFRLLVRIAYRFNWLRGVRDRRVLILGAGKIGRRFEEQVHQQQPNVGLVLVGFLDDSTVKQAAEPDVLGGLDKMRDVVRDKWVEDVVVALPLSAYQRLNWVVSELHDLPVRVWVIPDYFSLTLHRAQVEELAGIPMLDLRAPALSEYQRMVKRGFDIVITILALPIFIPLMGMIALAITLDSKGPVFYRPIRVGENGRMFMMFKFRTMIINADQIDLERQHQSESERQILKRPNDPRVTRVGRFLRKSSLDEIPQLFNVLKGEMSLVGPRPEQPFLVQKYAPWQRKRFAMPQGMTGWWQVNGRSDKPMHLHTEDDLFYLQHYSIWLDIQILIRTVWVVFRGKGAY